MCVQTDYELLYMLKKIVLVFLTMCLGGKKREKIQNVKKY